MSIYRIRMKFGSNGNDFAKPVWEAGLVGIWFGSWDVKDLYDSYEAYRPKANGEVSAMEIESFINGKLASRGLPANMRAEFVSTIKMFDEKLHENDWVLAYFDGYLHVGQIADENPIDVPAFEVELQHFKAKKLKNVKEFELARLPDVFRVLPSAGRQTLHQLGHRYNELASLLVESSDVNGVLARIAKLDLGDWIDSLGPKGWESICTAYLILEHEFLPAGLLIGSTLADFDIVGHNLTGAAIYAQCKKTPGAYSFTARDAEAFDRLPQGSMKFFFPFGGPEECHIPGVECISYDRLHVWLNNTESGRKYAAVLRSGC